MIGLEEVFARAACSEIALKPLASAFQILEVFSRNGAFCTFSESNPNGVNLDRVDCSKQKRGDHSTIRLSFANFLDFCSRATVDYRLFNIFHCGDSRKNTESQEHCTTTYELWQLITLSSYAADS